MTQQVNRRDISGIYIFYKFPDEDQKEPTCFEDCPEAEQDKWMNSIDAEAVKNLAKQLARTLRSLGDQLDIYGR